MRPSAPRAGTLLSACAGAQMALLGAAGHAGADDAAQAAVTTGAAAPAEGVTEEMIFVGEGLYMINCRMCHGTRGTAGNPLAGNGNLQDRDRVTSVILEGPGYMTGFADFLDDSEIALVATYVRNSWGNDFGLVTEGDVASQR